MIKNNQAGFGLILELLVGVVLVAGIGTAALLVKHSHDRKAHLLQVAQSASAAKQTSTVAQVKQPLTASASTTPTASPTPVRSTASATQTTTQPTPTPAPATPTPTFAITVGTLTTSQTCAPLIASVPVSANTAGSIAYEFVANSQEYGAGTLTFTAAGTKTVTTSIPQPSGTNNGSVYAIFGHTSPYPRSNTVSWSC